MTTTPEVCDSSVELFHLYAPARLTPMTSEPVDRHSEMPPFAPLTDTQRNVGAVAAEACGRTENPVLVTLVDEVSASYAQKNRQADDTTTQDTGLVSMLSAVAGLRSIAKDGPGVSTVGIYRESDFVGVASELVDAIHSAKLPKDYRLVSDGRYLQFGSRNNGVRIKLQGFADIPEADYPSCQVLDAAWTLSKLQYFGPSAITILPQESMAQQLQTAILVGVIPEFHNNGFNVTSILTDPSGLYTSEFNWPILK